MSTRTLPLIAIAGLLTGASLSSAHGPDLKSAGALAFAPEGTLLIGDQISATIVAIPTGDDAARGGAINVDGLAAKIAAKLGTTTDDILINDLAIHPGSGRAYVSVSRGRGPDAIPVIVRVSADGAIDEFPTDHVQHTIARLPNVPGADATDRRGNSLRTQSITDLAYFDGQVFVAGLSNEEFASSLLSMEFPFGESSYGASVEIYHGAHGAYETRSPVRTFLPFNVGGDPHLMAAYTCTPLVIFPIDKIQDESHVRGTTVAELGNRNRPLDMIVYEKGGETFVLVANSSRGVMKITTKGIEDAESITSRVGGGGTAGLSYDTINSLEGVEQLDKLDDTHAVVLIKDGNTFNLRTIELP